MTFKNFQSNLTLVVSPYGVDLWDFRIVQPDGKYFSIQVSAPNMTKLIQLYSDVQVARSFAQSGIKV